MEFGFERHQTDPEGREVAVEVVVFRAGFVFAHAGVAHPVVAAFAAAPVAAGQFSKAAGAAAGGRMAGGVEGDGGLFVFVAGGGARDHDQGTRSGQPGFQRFERKDLDLALVEASVTGVRLFGVGKRGAALAFCNAVL